MTEKEAIKDIRMKACSDRYSAIHCSDDCMFGEFKCPFQIAIDALEEIQQYRAIGTVAGYERAIEISKENFRLSMEYKAKVQEYEEIGTVEECRTAAERMKPRKPIELDTWGEYYKCPVCGEFAVDNLGCKYKFCRECGTKFDWSE